MFGGFETVGSFGPVVQTLADGGEGEIRANAALAFGKEHEQRLSRLDGPAAAPGSGHKPRRFRQRRPSSARLDGGFVVEGRRLLADGDGQVRLELVIADERGGPEPLAERLETLVTSKVYVVREGQPDLIDAGFHVARLYLAQSAKTTGAPSEPVASQLLREGAGSPFLVVLHEEPYPDNGGTLLEGKPAMFDAVTCQLMHLAGRSTGVWEIWGSGPPDAWLGPVRMLCRIVCQLSEITSLTRLQQDPHALAPHLLDFLRTDNFVRVRTGQLARRMQGVWQVAAIQPFAAQHLRVAVDEAAHSREQLTQFLRRDNAGAVAAAMDEIARKASEATLLKNTDRDRLAALLASQAANNANYFDRILQRANLPQAFRLEKLGRWTGDHETDAYILIDWALSKKSNPAEPTRSTLASILLPQLARLGLEDSAVIVATISAYRLIHDGEELAALQVRYQAPVQVRSGGTESLGPDFEWHGPKDNLELQSWLGTRPPDFIEVGYMIKAIGCATSVCRIEVGVTGERGTGVLVHDRYVLTNYHVVAAVLVDGKVAPEAVTVRLTFGGFGEKYETFEVALDDTQPIVDWSPVGELDYALLHLAPDIARAPNVRPATLSPAAPAIRSPLNILQHPEGGSMKLAPSENAITFVDPESGIVQYVTRTSEGSSGAPCFNDRWELVAIHHAERSRPFGSIREGILIGPIRKRIDKFLT